MTDARHVRRTRALKAAKIVFNHSSSVVDCTVRDLSAGGALLLVTSPLGIPDTFDLVFEADQSSRPARVMWRKESRLGVQFA